MRKKFPFLGPIVTVDIYVAATKIWWRDRTYQELQIAAFDGAHVIQLSFRAHLYGERHLRQLDSGHQKPSFILFYLDQFSISSTFRVEKKLNIKPRVLWTESSDFILDMDPPPKNGQLLCRIEQARHCVVTGWTARLGKSSRFKTCKCVGLFCRYLKEKKTPKFNFLFRPAQPQSDMLRLYFSLQQKIPSVRDINVFFKMGRGTSLMSYFFNRGEPLVEKAYRLANATKANRNDISGREFLLTLFWKIKKRPTVIFIYIYRERELYVYEG